MSFFSRLFKNPSNNSNCDYDDFYTNPSDYNPSANSCESSTPDDDDNFVNNKQPPGSQESTANTTCRHNSCETHIKQAPKSTNLNEVDEHVLKQLSTNPHH